MITYNVKTSFTGTLGLLSSKIESTHVFTDRAVATDFLDWCADQGVNTLMTTTFTADCLDTAKARVRRDLNEFMAGEAAPIFGPNDRLNANDAPDDLPR